MAGEGIQVPRTSGQRSRRAGVAGVYEGLDGVMDGIKPCPFCGGKSDYFFRNNVDKRNTWLCFDIDNWVSCEDCGSSTCMHETSEGAIDAWNVRYENGT